MRVHPISLFRTFALVLVFVLPIGGAESKTDFGTLRAQVLALGEMTAPPASAPAEGFAAEGRLRPIFFESVPWRGRPTRVFAWVGVPETAAGAKVPGVVLVHGGGGTAFKEWVEIGRAHV